MGKKVGIFAKIYLVLGIIFLFQLITKTYFISAEITRQNFVVLPGDWKLILFIVISIIILIILFWINLFLKIINGIFKTSFSAKKLHKIFIKKFGKIFLISILFVLSAFLFFFLTPKFVLIDEVVNSSSFLNAFLFSFLSSFYFSDKFSPIIKEMIKKNEKIPEFKLWPIITIIFMLISIIIISILA